MTIRLRIGGAVAALAAALLPPAPAPAAEADRLPRQLYLQYCSACHGETGKGDGIVSQLMRPRPSDLTTLAARAGGTFPYYQVLRTIDGRETVRAHGDPDMPVWGTLFTEEAGSLPDRHAVARGKVVLITDYLESIQGR